MFRARRLEKSLDITANIYYKYEGVSPTGNHKPNTAVLQAFYNAEASIKKITKETGAGQCGSSMAFAGAFFDIEVKVYMLKIIYQQRLYRRALIEYLYANCYASSSDRTKQAGLFWNRILIFVEV